MMNISQLWLFVLLIGSTIGSSWGKYYLELFSPAINSVIGTRIYLAFELRPTKLHNNDAIIQYPHESHNFALKVVSGNRVVFEMAMKKSIFTAILDDPELFQPGANNFSLQITYYSRSLTNPENFHEIIQNITLFSMKELPDPVLNAFMTFIRPIERRHRSYGLFGFDILKVKSLESKNKAIPNWEYLVGLNGDRYEIFSSQQPNKEDICNLIKKSARITHCHYFNNNNLTDLFKFLFVDYFVVNMDALIEMIREFEHPVATGNSSSVGLTLREKRLLNEIVLKILSSTRILTSVFVSKSNFVGKKFIENFMMKSEYGDLYFSRSTFGEQPATAAVKHVDSKKHLIFDEYEVWHMHAIVPISRKYIHTLPTTKTIQTTDSFSGNTVLRNVVSESRLLMNSFRPSRSFVLLSNVCLQRSANVLVLFNDNITRPILNMNYLAAEEDRGFLYSGLMVTEVPPTPENSDIIFRHYKRWSGMSALSLGVTPGHMAHETEPLVQFLHAALAVKRQADENYSNVMLEQNTLLCEDENFEVIVCNGSSMIDKSKPHNNTNDYKQSQKRLQQRLLARKYNYIMERLERIVFGTLSSENINDWVYSMINAILHATPNARSNHKQPQTDLNKLPIIPAVYLKEYLFLDENHNENTNIEGICFDELLLLGRSNSHVSYFGSIDAASLLKQEVFNATNISMTDELLAFSTNARRRLMKITVILRADSRRIVNLDAFLELCSNFKNVEKDWLENHIYFSFELLSFEQQVSIVSSSDLVIAMHGAAVLNGIFMKPESALIEIINGPFFDSFFSAALKESGVGIFYVPVIEPQNQCINCIDSKSLPPQCSNGSILQRTRIECIQVRSCDVIVNLELLEINLYQAYQHILQRKWNPSNEL